MRELTERLQVATEQFERERETADGLRESLRQSEERERLITEKLEAREEAAQQRCGEAEREREAMELQHYRALEAERGKWEAREQRVVDELERSWRDKTGWGGVDSIAVSGQLEEAQEEL